MTIKKDCEACKMDRRSAAPAETLAVAPCVLCVRRPVGAYVLCAERRDTFSVRALRRWQAAQYVLVLVVPAVYVWFSLASDVVRPFCLIGRVGLRDVGPSSARQGGVTQVAAMVW